MFNFNFQYISFIPLSNNNSLMKIKDSLGQVSQINSLKIYISAGEAILKSFVSTWLLSSFI
jgi:hypothetical protein